MPKTRDLGPSFDTPNANQRINWQECHGGGGGELSVGRKGAGAGAGAGASRSCITQRLCESNLYLGMSDHAPRDPVPSCNVLMRYASDDGFFWARNALYDGQLNGWLETLLMPRAQPDCSVCLTLSPVCMFA